MVVAVAVVGGATPAGGAEQSSWIGGSTIPQTVAAAPRVLAGPATISARLSATKFAVSRVGSVTVTYTFSRRSTHFGYVLARRSGARWVRVSRVSRTGSFSGRHTVRLTKYFAGAPVRVGTYRLTLSADGGSKQLPFTVTAVPAPAKPRAGQWVATSLTGAVSGQGATVTSMSFWVSTDQTRVSGFGFGYTYSLLCSFSGFSAMTSDNSAPIAKGLFSSPSPTGPWSGPTSGSAQGTFDSPTSAHGTGTMTVFAFCPSFTMTASVGPFSWTAAPWQPAG